MTADMETNRLKLRRIARSDASDIAMLLKNFDVARWLTRVPFPYGRSDAEAFTKRVEDTRSAHFAMLRDGRFIGCISSADHLGYWLGEPYWGQGFATEAAHAVVARHFTLGGEDLRSGYLVGNAASRNVLAKIGFVDAQLRMSTPLSLGYAVEHQDMILTRARWKTLS